MGQLPSNSLERALALLQRIGRTPGGLTRAMLMREYGVPRSSLTYILSRLEREGYVSRDEESRKYSIGLTNVILGRGALREIGLRSVSEPTMYRLAVDTGLAASLCVLENYRVVLLDRVEGPSFVRTVVAADGIDRNINDSSEAVQSQYLSREQRDIGIVLPPYTTAMGRALLAHIPKDRLNDFIAKVPIAGEPVSARAAQRQFLITLQEVRAQGYCLVEREQHTRSCALAAPIFDSQGALKAAVGVSCQRHSPVWDEEAALAETVRDAAWRISSRLKHNSTLASREREPMSDRI